MEISSKSPAKMGDLIHRAKSHGAAAAAAALYSRPSLLFDNGRRATPNSNSTTCGVCVGQVADTVGSVGLVVRRPSSESPSRKMAAARSHHVRIFSVGSS